MHQQLGVISFPPGTNSVPDGNIAECIRGVTMESQPLTIEHRLQRRIGRASRTQSLAVRFTEDEVMEITRAANASGVTPREWCRTTLLKACGHDGSHALFTELIATRMLLLNLLKPLVLGEKVSPAWVTEAMTMVRNEKHKAAEEVLQQYRKKE
jgi:hypothetical protein